jgi:hypothetical protein
MGLSRMPTTLGAFNRSFAALPGRLKPAAPGPQSGLLTQRREAQLLTDSYGTRLAVRPTRSNRPNWSGKHRGSTTTTAHRAGANPADRRGTTY